ncbi:S-layer homology domain-containing protein [Geomicrobium sp. JCM 19038]|uniref:S-layer homology domain-containing protein n=1 Tax=Geomicrobium sp. JCM 19038 TaxID=1460635 RepID=UPI00045F2FF6|nr:hypothetical protein JCM19038_1791 [Geomicrobium sp. JCM 19038]
MAPFTDLDNIDEETQPYVNMLYRMNIYQGRDGVLSPSERSSRAQTAVVFYRLIDEMQSLHTTR